MLAAAEVADQAISSLLEITDIQGEAVKDLLQARLSQQITKERAALLHKIVGVHWEVLSTHDYKDHNDYASEVIGRTISSFTELTYQDEIDIKESVKDGFYPEGFDPAVAYKHG